MSSIFTSIEFYITALAVAVIIIAFFGTSDNATEATSDIYSPMLLTGCGNTAAAEPAITLRSMDDGSIEVTRHGLTLPPQCSIYIKADFVKDQITFTERLSHDSRNSNVLATPCSLHFTTRPRQRKKYFIRYEAPESALWGTAHFANYDGYTTTLPLKS